MTKRCEKFLFVCVKFRNFIYICSYNFLTRKVPITNFIKMIRRQRKRQTGLGKFFHLEFVLYLLYGKIQAICLISLFLFVCYNHSYSQTANTSEHIIIDLDAPRGEALKASSLFKNVKTIILEENSMSLLGGVSRLQVFDGHLYVLDTRIAKCLFVFDFDGKFIRKIGGIGRGPGEYTRISDFTIDRANKILYVLDDLGLKANKHRTSDGTYIESIRLDVMRNNPLYIQYYDNALFVNVKPWDSNADDFQLLKIDPKTGTVLEKFFKASQHNKGWNLPDSKGRTFFNESCGVPVFCDVFMDGLISLDGMVPVLSIRSKDLATSRDVEALKQKRDYVEYLSAFFSLPKIHAIRGYIEQKNFIHFAYWQGVPIFVLYDLKTGLMHNGIENDLRYRDGKKPLWIFSSDEKGAYEIIQPDNMDSFIKELKNNRLVSNIDKLDELKKLNEEANPVIFYYEFKDAE